MLVPNAAAMYIQFMNNTRPSGVTMAAASVAWLAGIVEGEGNIDHRGKGRACLTVAMTDQDVVERCAAVSGCGTVRGPLTHSRHPDRKPFWRWTVAKSDDVVALLAAMRPWLGSRRQQRVDEVLAAWAVNPPPKRLRTHCVRGHEYNEKNTFRMTNGGRGCRPCAALKAAEYRKRHPDRVRATALAQREKRKLAHGIIAT